MDAGFDWIIRVLLRFSCAETAMPFRQCDDVFTEKNDLGKVSVQLTERQMHRSNYSVKVAKVSFSSSRFHYFEVSRHIVETWDGTRCPRSRSGQFVEYPIFFFFLLLEKKTTCSKFNFVERKRKCWATSTYYPFVILWVKGLFFGRANDDITPTNRSLANSKLHFPVFLKSFLIASFK